MIINQLVPLQVDEKIYALTLNAVERIINAVEITPLPKAPEHILGIINYQGQIIPVINMRRLFHLPEREIIPADKLVIARTMNRTVVLTADSVRDLIDYTDAELIRPEEICPGIEFIKGVVKINDEIIMIYDLETFISIKEDASLSEALQAI